MKLAGEVYSAENYAWRFYDYDEYEETSTEASPQIVHKKLGTIEASLTINEGGANETKLSCSPVEIEYASITDCACTAERISKYEDLEEDGADEVKYRWTVSGCKSYGTTEFTYYWEDYGYAQDETNPNVVTRSFTEKGAYSPGVQIYNQDGNDVIIRCDAGIVKKGGDYTITLDYAEYQTLYAGKYVVSQCEYCSSGKGCVLEVRDYDDAQLNWFKSDVELDESYGDYAYLNVSYPLQLNIPDGKKIELGSCYNGSSYVSGGKF